MANRRSGFFLCFISARLKKSPLQSTPEWLAIVLMLALVVLANGKIALAQELDSGQLQKETAAKAAQQKQASDSTAQQGQPAPSSTQPQNSQPQNSQPQASGPPSSPFTLPAGTKLPLGLLRPLKLKPGKDVYLQVTFPVTVGNQMVIPPGTYVQGVVTKVIRKDRRRYSVEFEIGSANLIFSNGYTVPIAGVVAVATTYASLQSPRPGTGDGQSIPAMAAVRSTTTPALPGIDPNFGSGVKKTMIAVGVIAGAATVAAIVFALRSDPYLEAGTPLQIILPAPVSLDSDRVMTAIQQYDQQTRNAPPQIVQPPVRPRTCYDPGTPGTPDTVIPGTPGTPPNGDFPGTPSTPDTVIPGTPGTPGRSYPCPK